MRPIPALRNRLRPLPPPAVMLAFAYLACAQQPLDHSLPDDCPEEPLRDAIREQGRLPVIVTLELEAVPEAGLTEPEAAARRRRIAELREALIAELERFDVEVLRTYERFPLLALEVDEAALCHLLVSPMVRSVDLARADPPGGA
jgi:hypothetical protein